MAAATGLAPALTAVRLGLHVLSAAIWVGGQIVMAGIVPAARGLEAGATKVLARAFARLSWPAFVVVVATGFWNVSTFHLAHQATAWKVVLGVKIAVVAVAGLAAFLHGRASTRAALAAWGSVAGVFSVAALFLGVLLAGP